MRAPKRDGAYEKERDPNALEVVFWTGSAKRVEQNNRRRPSREQRGLDHPPVSLFVERDKMQRNLAI